MQEASTVLIIHQDADALDQLTRLFESRKFEVITAATSFQAQARLEGESEIRVVVAQWDDRCALGGDVYRWAVKHAPKLRGQFVFVAATPPDGFDALVAGRCLLVHPDDHPELLRVAIAATRRSKHTTAPPFGTGGSGRKRLLLVEDEPILLLAMAEIFDAVGFTVTPAEGGRAAIETLKTKNYDVIVTDWHMDDGTGAELYQWIKLNRPLLVNRIAVLTDGRVEVVKAAVPGVPVFPKGQDADALMTALRELAGAGPDIEPDSVDDEW